MTAPNILTTLLETETARVEWKESSSDANKILQAVCALANDLGDTGRDGHLLIGVDKSGIVKGLGVSGTEIDNELRLLSDRLRSVRILPTPAFEVEAVPVDDKIILLVTVHPSPVPPAVSVDSVVWVRSGSTTVRARDADLQRLLERRPVRGRPFDSRPVLAAALDDLNVTELRRAYDAARDVDPDEATFPPFEYWLTHRQLGERVEGRWRPYLAALLVYGRSPQDFLSGAYVDFIRYRGTDVDAEIYARKTVTGTLPDQLDVLWAQLEAHNGTQPAEASGIHSPFVSEYPAAALKELARNLVQHRTYESTHAPGRVEWFDNRIEFSNPGGPFGRSSEGTFGEHSDYRNPALTAALLNEGYVEAAGRGVRRVRHVLDRFGHPPIEVTINGFTRVVVWRRL